MDKPMNRIKEVLEERGIKQTWLAERLGKSFCIVNSYVCNRRQPSLEVLFEIAKILNVNPKEPFWHFEMALNKVKQLVRITHELFFYCLHRSG